MKNNSYKEIAKYITEIIEDYSELKKHPKPDITVSKKGLTQEEIVKKIKAIGAHSPRVDGKKYLAQLFSGKNDVALIADMAASLYNIPMHTFKASGIHLLIEKEIIKAIGGKIGFQDGIVCPGGSIANLTANVIARYYLTNTKDSGINKRFRIYASDQAHYGIKKNAAIIGVGRENVVHIPSINGVMNYHLLEIAIQEDLKKGYTPLMIFSISGTTTFGYFDNLVENDKIAKKYKLWHHVDACFGGVYLFSKTLSHRLRGVENCDSMSWDAHKLFSTPLTAAVLLVKKKGILELLGEDAEYLFGEGHEHDQGHKSIQCARRNDALKVWALLNLGEKALNDWIEKQIKLCEYMAKKIMYEDNLELATVPILPLICFRSKKKNAYNIFSKNGIKCSQITYENKKWLRISLVNINFEEKDIDRMMKLLK